MVPPGSGPPRVPLLDSDRQALVKLRHVVLGDATAGPLERLEDVDGTSVVSLQLLYPPLEIGKLVSD